MTAEQRTRAALLEARILKALRDAPANLLTFNDLSIHGATRHQLRHALLRLRRAQVVDFSEGFYCLGPSDSSPEGP